MTMMRSVAYGGLTPGLVAVGSAYAGYLPASRFVTVIVVFVGLDLYALVTVELDLAAC